MSTKSLVSCINSGFPILDGANNFAEWRERVMGLMVAQSKWYIVNEVDEPRTSASSRRTRDRLRQDAASAEGDANTSYSSSAVKNATYDADRNDVWGLLFSSTTSEVKSQLTEEATAPGLADAQLLWRELHAEFDKTDGQTAADLQQWLWQVKLKEKGDAVKHLVLMKSVFRKLTIAGEAPSDRILAQAMLKSLTSEYSLISSNLHQTNQLTSARVMTDVRTEWRRLGSPGAGTDSTIETTESVATTSTALVAESTSKTESNPKAKAKKSTPKVPKKCTHHPDSTSHDTKDCFVEKDRLVAELQKRIAELEGKQSTAAIASATVLDEEDGAYYHGQVANYTALAGKSLDPTAYVIDSGADVHMVCNTSNMSDLMKLDGHQIITAGNICIPATHKGTLNLGSLVLPNVRYSPTLGCNLISVLELGRAGYKTTFEKERCDIIDPEGKLVLSTEAHGLYTIKASGTSVSLVAQSHSADDYLYLHRSLGHLNWMDLWKLAKSGKLGSEWTEIVHPKKMNLLCQPCVEGKGHVLPAPPSDVRALKPNQVVHIDLWGPAPRKSFGNSLYFLTCYDDHSRHIQLYMLKSKSEALDGFRKYLALVENQCETKIKMVRSDNGGEFISTAFQDLLVTHGIIFNPVPPGAHAQNGRVERVHRTVMDGVRTILADTGLPQEFWAEAAQYVVYVRNRVLKKGETVSPQELWTGKAPKYDQLRPFGSTVFVRSHKDTNKLQPRYFKAFLMGYRTYSESTIRYFNPEEKAFNYSRDYIFERKCIDSPRSTPRIEKVDYNHKMNVTASPEVCFPLSPAPAATPDPIMSEPDEVPVVAPSRPTTPTPPQHEDETPDDTSSDVQSQQSVEVEPPRPLTPKRSTKHYDWEVTAAPRGESLAIKGGQSHTLTDDGRRINPPRAAKKPPIEFPHVDTSLLASSSEENNDDKVKTIQFGLTAQTAPALEAYCLLASDCPKTFRQARNSSEWPKWQSAMQTELAKMDKYDVWDVVERTDDMRVLDARWVYTRKIDGNTGEAAEYRARWVAKGYRQIEGVDYNEIFASVAHKDTIRVFLAAVNYHRLLCDQVDIKAAFLNGDLQETIYLSPAEGSGTSPKFVYRLKKSLYGLKQSPRCFNDKLDTWLKSEGFTQASSDACLYTYRKGGVFIMLTIHVDDQLIAGNDRKAMDEFKKRLNQRFECTDHGPVNYFLGFNVIRDVENRTLSISQEHYIEHMLARFDMSDCKPEKTPLPGNFLAKEPSDQEHAEAKHQPYPAIVVSIMYAASITRPDLAFPASLLARFITKWGPDHYRAAKHLLRYIRGTSDLCLTFDAAADKRTLKDISMRIGAAVLILGGRQADTSCAFGIAWWHGRASVSRRCPYQPWKPNLCPVRTRLKKYFGFGDCWTTWVSLKTARSDCSAITKERFQLQQTLASMTDESISTYGRTLYWRMCEEETLCSNMFRRRTTPQTCSRKP